MKWREHQNDGVAEEQCFDDSAMAFSMALACEVVLHGG